MPRQFAQHVQIARYQVILGYDGNWIAELRQNFQAASRQFEPAFHRLVAVGYAADRDDFGLPFRRGQFFMQKLGRVFFHHDFGLEVQAGGESEIFVKRPRIAINAAVLAAAVRIDAGFESDIRAVVVRNDRGRPIAEKLGARKRIILRIPIRVGLQMDFFEAVGRVGFRSAVGSGVNFQGSVFRVQFPVFSVRYSLLIRDYAPEEFRLVGSKSQTEVYAHLGLTIPRGFVAIAPVFNH